MARRIEYQKSDKELSNWQPPKGPHVSHSLTKGQVHRDRINVNHDETKRILDEINYRLAHHDEKLESISVEQQRLARIEAKMGELQRELAEIRRSKGGK